MDQKRSVEELSFYSEPNSLEMVACDTMQVLVPPNSKVDKILIQARDGDVYISLDGTSIGVGEGYKILQDAEPILIPQVGKNVIKVIGNIGSKIVYTWGY